MADGILILCDDLIFTSKIAATARAHGLAASVARTQDALVAKLAATPTACVIVDLHNATLNWESLFPQLGEARPRFVGFGSHVDVETLQAARRAGCDSVMPRNTPMCRLANPLPRSTFSSRDF